MNGTEKHFFAKLASSTAARATVRGLIQGLFSAGVIYHVSRTAERYFRTVVVESSRGGSETWPVVQYSLGAWGYPGLLVTVWVALLLCMLTTRGLAAMSAVGLATTALLCLTLIWRNTTAYAEYSPGLLSARPNSFSLDPTLFVILPTALCWIAAYTIDRVVNSVPWRLRLAKVALLGLSVAVWASLTWYGMNLARAQSDPLGYLFDLPKGTIPRVHVWLMAASIPVGVLAAFAGRPARTRNRLWRVSRSVALPALVAVGLVVLLVVQPSPAEGHVTELDVETGYIAEGHKVRGFWEGPVTYKDEEGRKRKELCFWSGLLHGRWQNWDEAGTLLKSGFFYRGEKFGPWKTYLDGKVAEQEFHSVPRYLSALSRNPMVETADDPSTRLTRQQQRYETGRPEHQCDFAFGVRHGSEVSWNEDGSVRSRETWVLGWKEDDGETDSRRLQILTLHKAFAEQLQQDLAASRR